MKTIDRQQFIAEELIREHVRGRISHKIHQERLAEQKIRKVVRKLLETETGTDEPSEYTGINVLANLLEKVIPIIQDDYKMLTTSDEQRESFRNHIIHAMKNALRPIESAAAAENIPESFVFDIDEDFLLEKMKIDISPEGEDAAEDVEGEFIDIEGPDEGDEFVHLDNQNETGRNFAADTFKRVEKQIVDAYDMLADEEDQKMFYDYLITNMLLYFDKFEDELQATLPDSTTPEYEAEKAEEETEGEGEPDELAADEPAAEEEVTATEEPAAEDDATTTGLPPGMDDD
jgi:pilus assembly protein FimV